jgi:hypothetical protein
MPYDRIHIKKILRACKPPKENIFRKERIALSKLKKRDDIVVLRSDEGNATVILDTEDYKAKVYNVLNTNP